MPDTDALKRYLLGQLDEAAMAALEEQYFRDTAAFEELEAALDDLTDAYVRGTLSADDQRIFALRYGTTADGISRIAFARTLGAYRAPTPATVAPRGLSLLRATREFRQQPVALQLLALAALLVLVVGGPVTVSRNRYLERELSRMRGDVRDLASSAATERVQRDQLERRLADVSTSAFDLLPGTDRSGGTTLLVPQSAGFVRLQLALESPPPLAPLRVVIMTADRAVLWSKVVADSAPGAVVDALVPAALFAPGEYQVRLSARYPDGTFQDLASYGFRVRRR